MMYRNMMYMFFTSISWCVYVCENVSSTDSLWSCFFSIHSVFMCVFKIWHKKKLHVQKLENKFSTPHFILFHFISCLCSWINRKCEWIFVRNRCIVHISHSKETIYTTYASILMFFFFHIVLTFFLYRHHFYLIIHISWFSFHYYHLVSFFISNFMFHRFSICSTIFPFSCGISTFCHLVSCFLLIV